MRTRIFLSLIIISFQFILTAQRKEIVYWSDIIEEAIFSDKDKIVYSDIELSYDNLPEATFNGYFTYDLYGYLLSKYPDIPKDSLGRIIVEKPITLEGISNLIELNKFHFNGEFSILSYDEEHSENTDLAIHSNAQMIFDSCSFESISIFAGTDDFSISSSHVRNRFQLFLFDNKSFHPKGTRISVEIYECQLNGEININIDNLYEDVIYIADNTFYLDTAKQITDKGNRVGAFYFSSENSNRIGLENNIFYGNNSNLNFNLNGENINIHKNNFNNTIFEIKSSNIKNLSIRDNSTDNLFHLTSTTIGERIKILGNKFDGGFGLTQTLLPELYVDIDWSQFSGNKIFINVGASDIFQWSCRDCIPYFGLTDEELSMKNNFRELVSTYTKLYRISKENGDIESFNGAYSDLQKFYTRRYSYLNRTEGGLNNWFKWRLNQVLEVYVDYGTNPAQALVISFYIIIIFAVFYFFFPSEWDVTSKQKLLQQLKSAINKNEKGTFKAIINSGGLFILSFINALTLSLNAFVTLGFGTIPTRGLARYVCIVQGFMGWFLLGLFSVSLINQVIF